MASEFVRWICADHEGQTYEVTPADYERCPLFSTTDGTTALLRQFVRNELGGAAEAASGAAAHIRFMRKHELVDYCDASERDTSSGTPRGS